MSRTKIITVAICSVLIAACDRSAEQPAPASTPTEVVADSTAAPEQAAAVPENINSAVVLEATPNPLELCDGNKLGTVEVKWDVTAAAPSNFSIWVAAPGQERKLWMSSKDIVGSNKTGNWVRDQTKFSLLNKGVVVATTTVTVKSGACAGTAETAAPGTAPTE